MRPTVSVNQSSGESRLGTGCLIAFLLPFCAVGVGTAIASVAQVVKGDFVQAGFFAIFALAFGGAGFGLMAAAIAGRKRAQKEELQKSEYPDEPWRWNPDWAAGRIKSSGGAAVVGLWIFTVIWNAISIPAGIAGVREGLLGSDTPALIALLFPAIGVVILGVALLYTMRHRKYGVSVFEMAVTPGVIGKGVGGVLHTSVALVPSAGFQVKLTCINRVVRGSGKNRSVSERIQWEESTIVEDFQRDGSRRGTIVPIVFRLPPDVPATDDRDSRNRMIWRLEVEADVPGIDYHAQFEIPVFETPDTPDEEDATYLEASAAIAAEYEQPADSKIRVTERGRGIEVEYGRARNPGVAFGLTIFTAVWTGVVVFLLEVDAPLLFPIVFGFFDILMLAWTAWLWTGTTVVTAGPQRVTVASGFLFPAKVRTYESREITDTTVKVGMQSGNTPFYQVRLVRKHGRAVQAGWGIRDKREAEWLAARLLEAVGPTTGSKSTVGAAKV